MSVAVDKVFLNNPGKKGFAFYDFVKDEKKKNNCPLKIELDNCLERITFFLLFTSSFFFSCATNKPRASRRATLIYMSKHTFLYTNSQRRRSLTHWGQPWQCVNLATPHARRGHVPDWTPRRGSPPNWLRLRHHREGKEMRVECLNWKKKAKRRITRASLFVDWHCLQERRRVAEGKQNTSGSDAGVPTLLTFVSESSCRHKGEGY